MDVNRWLLIVQLCVARVCGLLCHQCEGWHGFFPMFHSTENTCLKLNNVCETTLYCVKISEPMTPEASYEPYRSECWFQNTLVIAPGNVTRVENGCYSFFDQAVPPKKWTYCFCNNMDYCNSSSLSFSLTSFLFFQILWMSCL